MQINNRYLNVDYGENLNHATMVTTDWFNIPNKQSASPTIVILGKKNNICYKLWSVSIPKYEYDGEYEQQAYDKISEIKNNLNQGTSSNLQTYFHL